MANGPGDQSEDKIRELIERADRAERDRQEIRRELREELSGIRGLLETALGELRTSVQRKTIASAVYEEGYDDALRDRSIPIQARRHHRKPPVADKGNVKLKLVVPAWVITAGAGAVALARSAAGAAKAHPVALAGLRQAAHLGKRHWLTATAAGLVGVGTVAGVTHIALAPSVTASPPPAAASPAPAGPGGIVPLPSSSRPPPSPRARLVKHHKATQSASPSATPPALSAQPSPSLLPSTAPAVPVTSPPANPPPSPPSQQGPGVLPQPSASVSIGLQAGMPAAGPDVRHVLRGIDRMVWGLTGGLTR